MNELIEVIKNKSIKEKIIICEKHWKLISTVVAGALTVLLYARHGRALEGESP